MANRWSEAAKQSWSKTVHRNAHTTPGDRRVAVRYMKWRQTHSPRPSIRVIAKELGVSVAALYEWRRQLGETWGDGPVKP